MGAINEPPTSAAWSYKMLGTLDNVFVVAPEHPLAAAPDGLTNEQLCLHRAIVISDSARFCHPLQTNLMEEQAQIRVDDFHSKVMLLRAGLGCGFLPAILLTRGLPRASWWKKRSSHFAKRRGLYGWRNNRDGLAQRWWRETLLASPDVTRLYQ